MISPDEQLDIAIATHLYGDPESYVPVEDMEDDFGQVTIQDIQREQFKYQTRQLVKNTLGLKEFPSNQFECPVGERLIEQIEIDNQILFSCKNPCSNKNCRLSDCNKTETKLIDIYHLYQTLKPELPRGDVKRVIADALGVKAIAYTDAVEGRAIKRKALLKWCQKKEKDTKKSKKALQRLYRNGKKVYIGSRPPKGLGDYVCLRPGILEQALSVGSKAIRLFIYMLVESEINLAQHNRSGVTKTYSQMAKEIGVDIATMSKWKKTLETLGYLKDEKTGARIYRWERFTEKRERPVKKSNKTPVRSETLTRILTLGQLAGLGANIETICEALGIIIPETVSEWKSIIERLTKELEIRLTPEQTEWYWTVEEPLIKLMARMEREGLQVDPQQAQAIVDQEKVQPLASRDHTVVKYFGDLDDTGTIKPRWDLNSSRTGRIVSGIQNLKKEYRNRLAPPDGYTLIKRDWSQAQLRVMAGLSEDPEMIREFDEGVDLHQKVADQIEAVRDRQQAKILNFGIPFGIEPYGLQKDFAEAGYQVSMEECQNIIQQWFDQYPNLKKYLEDRIVQAKEDGYIEDTAGRRRNFYGKWTAKHSRSAKASVCQLEESRMLRKSLVEFDQRIREEGLDARPYLVVHDCIWIIASEKDAPRAGAILQEVMDSQSVGPVKMKSEIE